MHGSSRQKIVSEALNIIDQDIEKELRKRDSCNVLIKPNMVSTCTPLAATHVDTLRAILKHLQKYESTIRKIVIGEGPAGSAAEKGFDNYGYFSLAEDYGVDFMDLNRDSYIKASIYQIDGNEIEVRIAKTSIEFDYTISVTLPKTHETVIYSGALKNFIMGSIIWDEIDDKIKVHGFKNRIKWDQHYRHAVRLIHFNLARLMKVLKPDLSLVDGFIAMEGNGPVNGTPLNLGVAVAGIDPVATDAVASSVMGFNPLDIGYLYYADKAELGTARLSNIDVEGTGITNVRKPSKPHENYALELTWKVDIEKYTG